MKVLTPFDSNTSVFYALRGGGAGSWGVIVSVTLRTFPIFYASLHSVQILAPTNESAGALMTLHAKHIFDWDTLRASQYSTLQSNSTFVSLTLVTNFPNTTTTVANAAMKPFLDDARSSPLNFTVLAETVLEGFANDLVYNADDSSGVQVLLGSRLVPAAAYRSNPDGIGARYTELLNLGAPL